MPEVCPSQICDAGTDWDSSEKRRALLTRAQRVGSYRLIRCGPHDYDVLVTMSPCAFLNEGQEAEFDHVVELGAAIWSELENVHKLTCSGIDDRRHMMLSLR